MKNNKANTSVLAGILVVVVLIIAIVIPWTLSLVDTRPSTGDGLEFVNEIGDTYSAWVAEEIEFTESVDIFSIRADLNWQTPFSVCSITAQIQYGNSVGIPPVVQFGMVSYSEGDWVGQPYFALAVPSGSHVLQANTYYIAINSDCYMSYEADDWGWDDYSGTVKTDPPGIAIMGDSCNDANQDDRFNMCSGAVLSFTLEGQAIEPDDVYGNNVSYNYTTEPTEPSPGIPDIIDTTKNNGWNVDWLVIIMIGLAIFVGAVAVVVILRV